MGFVFPYSLWRRNSPNAYRLRNPQGFAVANIWAVPRGGPPPLRWWFYSHGSAYGPWPTLKDCVRYAIDRDRGQYPPGYES